MTKQVGEKPLRRRFLGKTRSEARDYQDMDCGDLSHNGSWWSGWRDTCTTKNGVSAMLVGGCHAVDVLRWFATEGESAAANPLEVFAV